MLTVGVSDRWQVTNDTKILTHNMRQKLSGSFCLFWSSDTFFKFWAVFTTFRHSSAFFVVVLFAEKNLLGVPALFLLLGPKTYSGGRRAFQKQSGEEKWKKMSKGSAKC